jgi:DNA-binding MurR/RpiR family transcriptional regulator
VFKIIESNKGNLGYSLLIEVVGLIDTAKTVSIYGDEHALASLFPVRLDLTVKKERFIFIKMNNWQLSMNFSQRENDVVIFLNEFDKFLSKKQIDLLQKLNQRQIKVILFSQDQLRSISDYVTIHYRYGVPQSSNDGYYSLFYISNLLSELVIRYGK